MTETPRELTVTSSPHLAGEDSVPRIMHGVWLALLPAAFAAVFVFGYQALVVLLLATLGCVIAEGLMLTLRGFSWKAVGRSLTDGSAIVTGVLLALNLPASSPWWLVLVGALVAMSLGKHLFGGLGNNPFNPALVARVFLLISFPTHMVASAYTPPVAGFGESSEKAAARYEEQVDARSYATPLTALQEAIEKSDPEEARAAIAELRRNYPMWHLFVGNIGGSLGEVSALALLLGALLLFWRRSITWHIPIPLLLAVLLTTGLPWLLAPDSFANPLFHLLSGGLLLGAFFMATDMVTSPVSPRGMVVFGVGIGVITAVIRLWGGYPEGISFAILMMNGAVPLLDKYFKPAKFGAAGRRT